MATLEMEMVYRKVPRKFLVFKMSKEVAGEMALLLRVPVALPED